MRKKIQVANLISKLQKHVEGEVELSKTQVASAKILLDKSMSNAPTEGDFEHHHEVIVKWASEKS